RVDRVLRDENLLPGIDSTRSRTDRIHDPLLLGGVKVEGNLVPGEADKISDTLTNLRIEMVERLSKIETKLERVEDNECRMRTLERMVWIAAGDRKSTRL